MNSTAVLLITLVATGSGGGCVIGCGSEPAYPDPPAGSYTASQLTVRSDGREETTNVARVTSAFFPGARAMPMLGRIFTAEEFRPGGAAVAVLSEDYWKQRFSGAPDLIGRTIEIDGRSFVVVGVGPPNFRFPDDTRVWIPDLK